MTDGFHCVRSWPVAEITAARRGGRLLGSTCRRVGAADCRRVRQPDARRQLASLASGLRTSSSMLVAMLGGGNWPVAEITAAGRGVRLLRSCSHQLP
jgi:hypothetical protein